MKKAILTVGLFTLVLASTSFASPKNTASLTADNTVITSADAVVSQDAGSSRKSDFNDDQIIKSSLTKTTNIEGTGNQDSGGHKKLDE